MNMNAMCMYMCMKPPSPMDGAHVRRRSAGAAILPPALITPLLALSPRTRFGPIRLRSSLATAERQ